MQKATLIARKKKTPQNCINSLSFSLNFFFQINELSSYDTRMDTTAANSIDQGGVASEISDLGTLGTFLLDNFQSTFNCIGYTFVKYSEA